MTLAQPGLVPSEAARDVSRIAGATLGGQTGNLVSPPLSQAQLEGALLRADAIGAAALRQTRSPLLPEDNA